MGTWGTALFSDDTAADVRDDYRDLIGEGFTGPQATDALVEEWDDALKDTEEAGVFWLALASTQWHCGRLESRVKAKAIEIIRGEADLERWQDDLKQLKKRRAVLEKLRMQLSSPQPPEKRIPKRYRASCEWDVDEVIGYRLLSGNLFLFQIIGFHTDKGGTSPICQMLDWSGTEAPPVDVLKRVRCKGPQFMLGRLKETELPSERVCRLHIKLESNQKPGDCTVLLWSRLDQQLSAFLGIA